MILANESLGQWIRTEHDRLHGVEEWPDSPYKDAVLTAIRSTLKRLAASFAPKEPPQCMVCASRKTEAVVLQFPSRSHRSDTTTRLAA